MEEMVSMICREIELRKDYLAGAPIETLYFGGGTPSILTPLMLGKILNTVSEHYNCDWKEVTMESNPDDLNLENLESWKLLGIDRLSLGIQSFDETILKFYNRAHNAEESKAAIQKARNVGFEKFSIDLIYGFPYQDHSLWRRDLAEAISQQTGHISSYALTVEPKTAFGNWAKNGKFKSADEDFVAEQFEYLQDQTAKAGFIQYEVSNFGKPGQFALHNTNYWKGVPYLGIGPSAHSFDGKNRGSNPSHNPNYLQKLQAFDLSFREELLTEEERLNEYILTGLRTIWGIDFKFVQAEFDKDLRHNKEQILDQMDSQGWLIWKENNLSLSKTGMLLADSIAASLFV